MAETPLTQLIGSEKQVRWAGDIRSSYLQSMDKRINAVVQPVQFPELPVPKLEKLRLFLREATRAIVSVYPEAAWWIYNRHRLKEAFATDWEEVMSYVFDKKSKRIS